jgi:ribosomal protein S18 acetylase RimI-like enzyme
MDILTEETSQAMSECATKPLQCRAASRRDADACAPLIYASGVLEFGFFLGQPPAVCIAFLRFAFAARGGRFSWRRHHVAVDADGTVLGLMAAHDGRSTLLDDPHVVVMLWRFFGLRRTLGILMRGLVLESELPAPKRSQTLVAHCATLERARGSGVFRSLFIDALGSGGASFAPDRQIVLDVLLSNTRAQALYSRLGFIEQPRVRARSERLPRELESMRMLLRG